MAIIVNGKKYYYAKGVKVMLNYDTGHEEPYLLVPVITYSVTGYVDDKKITPEKIGHRYMPCVFQWIPETYYKNHKADIETQAKEDEREHRCLITNRRGETIRCPESNRCIYCPFAGSFDFNNGHDVSFEECSENGRDPETGADSDSDFDFPAEYSNPEDILIAKEEQEDTEKLLDNFTDFASKKCQRDADIIKAMMDDNNKTGSDIARNLGLKPNRTCEDINRIVRQASELAPELRAKHGFEY